jgi:hypothetical protein
MDVTRERCDGCSGTDGAKHGVEQKIEDEAVVDRRIVAVEHPTEGSEAAGDEQQQVEMEASAKALVNVSLCADDKMREPARLFATRHWP